MTVSEYLKKEADQTTYYDFVLATPALREEFEKRYRKELL